MDDEEEDMSQPISKLWETPFRDIKFEDQATQMAAGQTLAAVTAAVPTSQGHNNSINLLPCGLHRQPCIPFPGNAGLLSHFPTQFEPMEDRGERPIEEEEEEDGGEENHRMAAGPEEQAGVSVEVQIGRKLRQIGDKFHQEHIEMFVRHQRQNLPVWMRLTMALVGFLFPREALVPRPQGEQR
ncbi:BCL2 modifying factor 2 [Xenentodon cancila]